VEGRRVLVLPRTFAADRPFPLKLKEGRPEAVVSGLLRGEIVLAPPLARQLGRGVGDEITLESRRGPVKLRVAGTATEYVGGGMALTMDVSTARELLGVEEAQFFIVSARKGSENLAAVLQSFCDERGLLLQSNADFL